MSCVHVYTGSTNWIKGIHFFKNEEDMNFGERCQGGVKGVEGVRVECAQNTYAHTYEILKDYF